MSSRTPRQSSDLFIFKKDCREAWDQEPMCYQYGPVSQYHVDPPLHPYLVKGDGEMKFRPGWVSFFSLISFSGGRGGVQGQHVVWVLFEVKKIRQASRKHCRMRINAYHIDLYIHLQNLGRVFRCVKLVKANSEHTMVKQCLKIRKVEGVFIFQDLLYFLERVHPVHTLKHRTDSSCK